jgi:hypothetical protein
LKINVEQFNRGMIKQNSLKDECDVAGFRQPVWFGGSTCTSSDIGQTDSPTVLDGSLEKGW